MISAQLRLVVDGDGDNPVDLIALHLEWCQQRNLRPGSIENRRLILQRLQSDVGPLEIATEQSLQSWYRDLSHRVLPETRACELSNVQNFYRWLIRERQRADDPTVRLVRPRLQRRLPRPVSGVELRRAFDLAEPRIGAMLHLGAYAGLRACEIATLRAQDVDRSVKTLLVVDGKGGRQRIVPLHPEVARALDDANLPAFGPLFLVPRTGAPARAFNVSHWCNTFFHDNGIVATLHQLRHYFGTEMYRNCSDLRLVQETLGHQSPTTTALYAQFDPSKAAPAVNAIGVNWPEPSPRSC